MYRLPSSPFVFMSWFPAADLLPDHFRQEGVNRRVELTLLLGRLPMAAKDQPNAAPDQRGGGQVRYSDGSAPLHLIPISTHCGGFLHLILGFSPSSSGPGRRGLLPVSLPIPLLPALKDMRFSRAR